MRIFTRGLLVIIAILMTCTPDAMATGVGGRKLLRNDTPYPLTVVLLVRSSDDPRRQAGTKDVYLDPHQSQYVEYGSHVDIYLNGIRAFTTHDGERLGTELIVIQRGSPADNLLNSYNGFDFVLRDKYLLSVEGRHVR